MSGEGNTKRTPERVDAIANALRAGNTRRAAAAYGEIDRATFYRWLDEDATFRDMVEKAEADAEVRFVTRIATASESSWQAAAFWLERRRREEWQKSDTLELKGDPAAPLLVQTEGEDARRTLAETIAILAEVGVIPSGTRPGTAEGSVHAEADEVRSPQADEPPGGVPTS